MGIEFKQNFKTEDFKKSVQDNLKTNLERGMAQAATQIVTRTSKGFDVTGKEFQRYTKRYEKFKTDKGRNARPDLTFTGRMLAAIQTRVEKVGSSLIGRIFFSSSREAVKASGNQKRRNFFGLSEEQKQKIVQELRRGINE